MLISFVGCEWIAPYVKYHLSFSFVFKILFILNLDHSTVCYSLFCLSRERPFVPNVHMESIVWRPIRYTTLRVGWFAGFTHRFRRRTDMRIVALFWAEKGNQYSVKLTCQSPCWWASDVSLLWDAKAVSFSCSSLYESSWDQARASVSVYLPCSG